VSQFYVPDDRSAEACRKSQLQRHAISVSGVDKVHGRVKPYTGIVQSVVEDKHAPLRRWLITMSDVP
jgi:hypothetical protein